MLTQCLVLPCLWFEALFPNNTSSWRLLSPDGSEARWGASSPDHSFLLCGSHSTYEPLGPLLCLHCQMPWCGDYYGHVLCVLITSVFKSLMLLGASSERLGCIIRAFKMESSRSIEMSPLESEMDGVGGKEAMTLETHRQGSLLRGFGSRGRR